MRTPMTVSRSWTCRLSGPPSTIRHRRSPGTDRQNPVQRRSGTLTSDRSMQRRRVPVPGGTRTEHFVTDAKTQRRTSSEHEPRRTVLIQVGCLDELIRLSVSSMTRVPGSPLDDATVRNDMCTLPGASDVLLLEGNGELRRIEIGSRDIVIGRGGDCDVVICHPSLSRRHVILRPGPP